MNNPSILEKTAVDLIVALRNGEISSFELAKAFIDRTDKVDEKVNAFLHRDDENFLKQAREADKRRENGKQLGILDGLPVSLKDVISVKDQPLTAASKILENYVSPYDATVTKKVKRFGCFDLGPIKLGRIRHGIFY